MRSIHSKRTRAYLFVSNTFLFKFEILEDANRVLKKPWSIDSTPLLLKKWSPLFDASKERMNVLLIWVRMPRIPIDFWIELRFRELWNAMGTFMDADMSFCITGQMLVARILVSLDIRVGLAKEMELIWGDKHFH